MENLEPAESLQAVEMFTVANEYCLFTEKAANYPKADVVVYYARILPLLYLRGALLPKMEEDEDYSGERFVNEEQWEEIFNSLRDVFGKHDEYQRISEDSFGNPVENASIAEQLSDTYQDMKDFVMLYQKNMLYAKVSALRDCRELFINHWGPRITSILQPIHSLAFPATEEL